MPPRGIALPGSCGERWRGQDQRTRLPGAQGGTSDLWAQGWTGSRGACPRLSQASRAERNGLGGTFERVQRYLRARESQEKPVGFSQGNHDPGDLGPGQPSSHTPLGQGQVGLASWPLPGGSGAQKGTSGPEGGGCLRPQKLSVGGFDLSHGWESGRRGAGAGRG